MKTARSITPGISIAGQPTTEELEGLASEGYTAVVNLRHEGEPEQPVGVAAEGELVRGSGLKYLAYEVGGMPLAESGVQAVCDLIDAEGAAGGRVLLHCRKGGRAAAMVLIHLARVNGWNAAEAASRGAEAGLPVDGNLRVMVEQYLAAHPA